MKFNNVLTAITFLGVAFLVYNGLTRKKCNCKDKTATSQPIVTAPVNATTPASTSATQAVAMNFDGWSRNKGG